MPKGKNQRNAGINSGCAWQRFASRRVLDGGRIIEAVMQARGLAEDHRAAQFSIAAFTSMLISLGPA
jgi:hypothetical protein